MRSQFDQRSPNSSRNESVFFDKIISFSKRELVFLNARCIETIRDEDACCLDTLIDGIITTTWLNSVTHVAIWKHLDIIIIIIVEKYWETRSVEARLGGWVTGRLYKIWSITNPREVKGVRLDHDTSKISKNARLHVAWHFTSLDVHARRVYADTRIGLLVHRLVGFRVMSYLQL